MRLLSRSLMILAFLSLPANATIVLVNTSTVDRETLLRDISPGKWQATPITTDHSDYVLSTVVAEIHDFNPAGTLFMEMWSVTSLPSVPGLPGAKIERLSFTSQTVTTKTFSSNLALSANTSDFVVTGVDNGGAMARARQLEAG